MKSTIVIGNGVIGLCTAYYLAKEGVQVEVITRSTKNSTADCSHGNAGLIVPSHFIPLAAPGVIKQGIKWMFSGTSPFHITPRLNKQLFSWLWHFNKSATYKNVSQSKKLILDMNEMSLGLYESIIAAHDLDVGFKKQGMLMLCSTDHGLEEEAHYATLAKEMGLDAEVLNNREIIALEPSCSAAKGGVFYPSDAHLTPSLFMRGLTTALEELGVKFHYEETVNKLETTAESVRQVVTDKQSHDCEQLVIAAGSWSAELAKSLGINLPIQGGKGYHVQLENPTTNINQPIILQEARVAMTPMGNALRVAGTMEINGTNLSINHRRLQGMIDNIPDYLPDFNTANAMSQEAWAGLRPISPDGLPLIGRSKRFNNLSFNVGHAMMGLSLGPISGKLLAQMLTGTPTALPTSLLDPNRF